MDPRLIFEYDKIGDILYIRNTEPNAEQDSDMVSDNLVVRRNSKTRRIEGIEILFFTRWLLVNSDLKLQELGELFSDPGVLAHSGQA